MKASLERFIAALKGGPLTDADREAIEQAENECERTGFACTECKNWFDLEERCFGEDDSGETGYYCEVCADYHCRTFEDSERQRQQKRSI